MYFTDLMLEPITGGMVLIHGIENVMDGGLIDLIGASVIMVQQSVPTIFSSGITTILQ